MSDSYTPVQGLILLSYNAYYNRFLKFEASLQDYLDNSEGSDYLIKNVNFNPADGLNTIHVAGNGELDNRLEFRDYSFTYALLIEYNPDLTTKEAIYADEDTHILSKWFILDNDRTRGGQYRLNLRRDVLVDYMKQIKKSPIFVEKGIISDVESPLLTNNEDVIMNKIKKQEILLKDKTDCAWLVMYLKKGVLGSNTVGTSGKVTIDVPKETSFIFEELTTPIASWSFYQYISNDYKVNNYNVFEVRTAAGTPTWLYENNHLLFWDNSTDSSFGTASNTGTNLITNKDFYEQKTLLENAYIPERNTLRTKMLNAFGYKNLSALLKYNDKIIKDSTGKYFKVHVFSTDTGTTTHNITSADSADLKNTMGNIWNVAFEQSITPNDNAFKVKANWQNWRISLEELTDIDTTVDFAAYTGKGTTDSMLFDAICVPYGKIEIFLASEVSVDFFTEQNRSLKIMNSLATQLTSEYVLDLQLLPYCPCPDLVNDDFSEEGAIVVPEDDISDKTLLGSSEGNITDCILVCPSSNFTLDIEQKIEISDDSDVPDSFRKKYINDCTMIRLCSPNYNGLFEMNLAKNGGLINSFNVDVTLRPYNPYIHVNPDFNFLYGQDFNDVRGLNCGGDFSLGIINDAWNVYEIQNKNYQAIFDRQIQNLDVNNAIARQEAGWGMAAGVVSGAASGAAGGAIVGGGWGALAGAVIGAGTSAVGGAMDLANLQKRQQEARSYAVDNYNLQLGNIQALPYSLTKTSALTYNNKLFPFVEIYECSEKEKEAYYNKLYWNGMTVGIIDRITNYESGRWANYFRGKLIALYGEEGSNSVENRIIEAINTELMKGVFI